MCPWQGDLNSIIVWAGVSPIVRRCSYWDTIVAWMCQDMQNKCYIFGKRACTSNKRQCKHTHTATINSKRCCHKWASFVISRTRGAPWCTPARARILRSNENVAQLASLRPWHHSPALGAPVAVRADDIDSGPRTHNRSVGWLAGCADVMRRHCHPPPSSRALIHLAKWSENPPVRRWKRTKRTTHQQRARSI